MEKYQKWIDANYPDFKAAYGKCAEATAAMAVAFPELRRVRGWVDDAHWGEREHWWCAAPDGSVVDPTRRQFPLPMQYREWDESQGDPPQLSKCPNCGDMFKGGGYLCSQRCEREYAAYVSGGF